MFKSINLKTSCPAIQQSESIEICQNNYKHILPDPAIEEDTCKEMHLRKVILGLKRTQIARDKLQTLGASIVFENNHQSWNIWEKAT
jgi:hypothetical protein